MAFWSACGILFRFVGKECILAFGSTLDRYLHSTETWVFAFAHRQRGCLLFCEIPKRHRLVIGSNQTDLVLTLFPFRLFHLFEDAFSFP
jgi:hypothetical protein